MDNVFLVGKIDRISGGNIFDWKTARRPPSRLDTDVQFILYHFAYKTLFGKEPTGIYYGALSTGELVKYNHNEKYEELLLKSLLPKMIFDISQQNFQRDGLFKKSCYRCNYKKDCLKDY